MTSGTSEPYSICSIQPSGSIFNVAANCLIVSLSFLIWSFSLKICSTAKAISFVRCNLLFDLVSQELCISIISSGIPYESAVSLIISCTSIRRSSSSNLSSCLIFSSNGSITACIIELIFLIFISNVLSGSL